LRNLVEIFRRLIISPEFVVILVATSLICTEPAWLIEISNKLHSVPDGVRYIAIIPVGVFVWCIQQSRVILFPAEDTKGILLEWPKFNALKNRVLLGILFQLVFSISSLGAWFMSPSFDNPTAVVVLVMAIVGSLVCAGTFYLASMVASEITKKYSTKET